MSTDEPPDDLPLILLVTGAVVCCLCTCWFSCLWVYRSKRQRQRQATSDNAPVFSKGQNSIFAVHANSLFGRMSRAQRQSTYLDQKEGIDDSPAVEAPVAISIGDDAPELHSNPTSNESMYQYVQNELHPKTRGGSSGRLAVTPMGLSDIDVRCDDEEEEARKSSLVSEGVSPRNDNAEVLDVATPGSDDDMARSLSDGGQMITHAITLSDLVMRDKSADPTVIYDIVPSS